MLLKLQEQSPSSIGNCQLLEKIADSGMGTVYKGRSRVSGEVVAVKVMPAFEPGNAPALQRFARECRILSALKDPHIVRAIDFGLDGANPYLVMEFVEGETLGERLKREGKLPETEAVRLIAEVAGALGRAHSRGLVHRNVKPDKILITPDGKTHLTGLGLARQVDLEAFTRAGTILGTPNFMAPEQFSNASKATPVCDIYSLGATLYMAVTGELPFGGRKLTDMWARKLRNELPPPKKLVPALSERVDRAIRRAMSTQPELRQATCRWFVEELTGGSSGKSSQAPAKTAAESPSAEAAPLPGMPLDADTRGSKAELPATTDAAPGDPQPQAKANFGALKWLAVGLVGGALLLLGLALLLP